MRRLSSLAKAQPCLQDDKKLRLNSQNYFRLPDDKTLRLCSRRCFSVCLSVSYQLHKNCRPDLHEIFREGWQWATEKTITFWWRFISPSEDRDCLADSSLLGNMESGINRLRCVTLQCRACTSRRHHSNCDVITSPAHERQPRQPVLVNDVSTLVRRALAEVCTAPMLLVSYTLSINS